MAAVVTPSIAEKKFDFVIVGGGTAGLAIATRLTEDPKTSVIVLEAGEDRSDDVTVLAPGLLTALYGDPKYDWIYKSTPQPYANNKTIGHPRGKLLGGSSAINFLFWTHASQKDIDNWGALGNEGWSWNELNPFYKRSESYVAPSEATEDALQTQYIEPELHGREGPIPNTFPDGYGPLDEVWPRTYQNLGLAPKSDPRDGLALGGYTNLLNLNLKDHSRSYAATAYYVPAAKRPNLSVVTGALVEKVLLRPGKGKTGVTATGVQYTKANETFTVSAKHEVILSAGSIASPQLLELSGIGNPEILRKHGIESLVKNVNVGENLQDHVYVPIGFAVRPGIPTSDDFKNASYFEAAYAEYVANRTGPLATTGASSALLSLEQVQGTSGDFDPESAASFKYDSAALEEQLSILIEDLKSEAITQELTISAGISPELSEDTTKLFTTDAEGNFLTLLGVLAHPFSRGSIHIQSADPSVHPVIDPRYLSHPVDLEILSLIALHLQEVAQTAPLSGLLQGNGTEYQPGYYALNETNVRDWIQKSLQSEYHPAGTCAMMPKEKGGVVDSKFNVYGVGNLRVVDASVFPLLPRANIQTLVYAIAERAADWIKLSYKAT